MADCRYFTTRCWPPYTAIQRCQGPANSWRSDWNCSYRFCMNSCRLDVRENQELSHPWYHSTFETGPDQIFLVCLCVYLTNFFCPPLLPFPYPPVKSTYKGRLRDASITLYFYSAPFNKMQTVANERPHFSLSLIILAVILANRSSLHRLKRLYLGLF